MPANECIPFKSPAISVTGFATGAITGKRFVVISGPRVGGGVFGGTSQVTTAGPGYGANTLSTDVYDVYQVAQASVSGSAVFGVSGWDAPANSGDLSVLKVHLFGHGHVLPITAGAAITAGVEVQTDASGRAITLAAGKAIGLALDSASGAGVDCEILFY